MIPVLPVLSVLALAALLVLLGTRLPGSTAGGDGFLQRLVTGALAGMVVFHLLATFLDLAGLGWSALKLGSGLAVLLALGFRFGGRAPAAERQRRVSGLAWGDVAVLLALAVFALLTFTLWVTTPDFIFHWGLKGHRFFIAHGVDYPYLARSWNWPINPSYPNLLPELYAGSALLAGRFDPPSLMLWSVFALTLLLAAARETLRSSGSFTRQAGIALLAVVLVSFALRNQMAGGADWMVALALVAAIPPLSRPPDAAGDLQVGFAAAFAAASKLEGVVLAAILCFVQLARRPMEGGRLGIGRWARLGLPAFLVILPWWIQVRRYALSTPFRPAGPTWERAQLVIRSVLEVLNGPAWHGFAWAVLLLPLLAFRRAARPLAVVLGAQLAFYLGLYLTSAFDTQDYVATSFPRLLLHLLPALAVGVMMNDAPSWTPPPPGRRAGTRARNGAAV